MDTLAAAAAAASASTAPASEEAATTTTTSSSSPPSPKQQRLVTVEDIQARYKFWKKYVATLYDLVSNHILNAPVPCVEIIDTERGDWSKLITDNNEHGNGSDAWSKRHSRFLAVGAAGYDFQSSIEFFRVDIPSPSSEEPVSKTARVKTRSLFSAAAAAGEDELLVFRPNPMRSTLLASTSHKGLSVWDFEGRSTDFKCLELSKAYGQALAWQEERLLLGTHTGSVLLFDVAAQQQVHTLKSNVSFTELSPLPHGSSSVYGVEACSANEFISCSGDGSICYWDLRQKDGLGMRRASAHGVYGTSCISTVRGEGKSFLSGAGLRLGAAGGGKGPANPEVKLWDLRDLTQHVAVFTAQSSSRVSPEDQGCAVHQVRWNPNADNEFAACSEDGAVRLWDKSRAGGKADEDGPAELLFVHAGHVGAVTDFQWDTKFNRTLVSASDENIMIWRPLLNNF